MDEEHGPLASSLLSALLAKEPAAVDRAAAALALIYAEEVDRGGDLSKLGPAFLRTLDALQMTPKSRAMAQRGGTGDDRPAAPTRLDELRDRRARKRDTQDLDAPAEGPV